MTEAQKRLLELVSTGPADIHEAARHLGTTVAAISKTRNVCRDRGWIRDWVLWQGPIEITEDGRAELSAQHTAG